MPEYDIICLFHNDTCNKSCCSRENTIIHWVCIKRWFYSSCYWDLLLFSFSFQFIFYFLCSGHYSSSVAILFSSHDAYFLLSIAWVHCHLVCTWHCNFLMFCCIWETLFISSTHHNPCTFIISRFVTYDTFLVYDLIFVNVLVVAFLDYGFQFICV